MPSPERTWRLTDDALTWEEDGAPVDGAFYDDIAEVRMAFAPTRVARNRYRTQVIFREGGMTELFNTHYAGFADLEERNAEYAAFVRELHRRLAARSTPIRFRRGNSPAGYAASVLLTAFIFAMIALAFVLLFSSGVVWIAVVKLAIILFFVPTLIRHVRRSRPADYDPLDLSADVLPAR